MCDRERGRDRARVWSRARRAAGGDITAVTTSASSGLSGGANAGDVALELDVSNLPTYSSTLSGTDHMVLSDTGQPDNSTRRLTLSDYATWVAGEANGGIAATNGRLHIQPNELLISTAVADADRLMGWDQSAFAPRSFEASTLRDYFQEGGGGGDITAVTTPTNSGLSGGANTGDVDLLLDVSNLPIYNTTIDGGDHLVLSDESETDDPSRRFTLSISTRRGSAAEDNGGIHSENGQFSIRANELLISTAVADDDRVMGWDQSSFATRVVRGQHASRIMSTVRPCSISRGGTNARPRPAGARMNLGTNNALNIDSGTLFEAYIDSAIARDDGAGDGLHRAVGHAERHQCGGVHSRQLGRHGARKLYVPGRRRG